MLALQFRGKVNLHKREVHRKDAPLFMKGGNTLKKVEKKTFVYCGPNIPNVAKQFDTYTGGLPERLKQLSDEIPAIGALIVPLEEMAAARMELQKKGSALDNIFMKAKEIIEKGSW